MMFYMNSKTFQNDFLAYESYENIVNAQYVIASTRIRCNNKHDNVLSARPALFPDAEVASALTDDKKKGSASEGADLFCLSFLLLWLSKYHKIL